MEDRQYYVPSSLEFRELKRTYLFQFDKELFVVLETHDAFLPPVFVKRCL